MPVGIITGTKEKSIHACHTQNINYGRQVLKNEACNGTPEGKGKENVCPPEE